MTQKSLKKKKRREASRTKAARRRTLAWTMVAALVLALGLAYLSGTGELVRPPEPTPVFHESPDAAKPYPALLPASRFSDPVVSRAYEIAHEIPDVLAQQPCYCFCERFGHGSLLDCWASDHGAG